MEHIIFSKMLLFSSVYHHHKIRALECGVRSVFRRIWEDPSRIASERLRFPSIASMLTMTDEDFWAVAGSEPTLTDVVTAMYRRRELPMRALALNIATIKKAEGDDGLSVKFQGLTEFPERQRDIGDTIYQMLDAEHQDSTYGVWFDFPKTPEVGSDAKKTMVDRGDAYVPLKEFFPTDDWVAAYSDNKLTAHVFYDPPEVPRHAVSAKAREYFFDRYQITCKEIAVDMCFNEDEDDIEEISR
jgi:HD superfamily phosphohydrolase